MQDAIQWGTLILVGFSILLNRYDYNALRKEMGDIRKELTERMDRETSAIIAMMFKHEERLTRVEVGKQDKA